MKIILLIALVAIGFALATACYGALTYEPKLFEGGLIAAASTVTLAALAIVQLYLFRYVNAPVKCLRCKRDVKRIGSLGEHCRACIGAEKHNLIQLRQTLKVLRRQLNKELTAAEQHQQNELYHQLRRQ